MNLSERDWEVVWHPYTQAQIEGLSIAIMKASGASLWDENGKEYIDAVSSWWVNLHGHAHPYISECLQDQLQKFHHVMFAGFTHEPAVKLAEGLLSILPDPKSKIFYSDNGSTAVEAAIKMAAQYASNIGSSSKKLIALEGSYHGDTIGAMSVSSPGPFRAPFEHLMFEVKYIPRPGDGRALQELKNEIDKGGVIAFIFEPLLQGASGMNIYPASELEELVQCCRQAGVLTIADEVFTGFGRCGRIFASDYLMSKPDIFCLSKGLTGGTMALGVTVAPQSVFDAFLSESRERMFLHGHSYTANPLACTAGIASLEILLSSDCGQQRRAIEESHRYFLAELSRSEKVQNARMLGTILAFEIKSSNSKSYLNPLRDRLYRFFMDEGIIIRPLGNTIYLVPPYCIKSAQLDRIYTTISKALEKF